MKQSKVAALTRRSSYYDMLGIKSRTKLGHCRAGSTVGLTYLEKSKSNHSKFHKSQSNLGMLSFNTKLGGVRKEQPSKQSKNQLYIN